MSVAILYYKVSQERISSAKLSEQIADWIDELPVQKQQQVKKIRQQNDQVLSLAGLQLLKLGMAEFSNIPFSLSQLEFPKHAKPFIDNDIDFNISHSGNIVCCVISDSVKVGIDVELQRDVKLATLKKFLTEMPGSGNSSDAENNKRDFFNLWTKNEAIIKAANFGSIYNMHDIQHDSHGGHYQNHFWFSYLIDIVSADDNKEYTCHIACSENIPAAEIKLKQIDTL